jgi:hypothetical protein
MSRIVIVILIYHRHKPTDTIIFDFTELVTVVKRKTYLPHCVTFMLKSRRKQKLREKE